MTDNLISNIQSFTLAARSLLETEVSTQLEGIYGWRPNGAFTDPSVLPPLESSIPNLQSTIFNLRSPIPNPQSSIFDLQRIEKFAQDERSAGFDPEEARRRLVRETAFTWLNRLVAFKMMEERQLLKPTVSKLDKLRWPPLSRQILG